LGDQSRDTSRGPSEQSAASTHLSGVDRHGTLLSYVPQFCSDRQSRRRRVISLLRHRLGRPWL